MNTLEFVNKKFDIGPDTKSPVRLVFKRYDMAGMFRELNFKVGAEVGVYKGEFSETLCLQNPGLKLYCIDPWIIYESEVPEFYANNQKFLDECCQETGKRLAPYKCKILRETSMEAVKHFAPETLDFVYIDANHDYSHVLEDIEAWAKIVKPGGIVSGHDYGHYKYWFMTLGSRRAIDTYVKNHGIKMLFLPNRNYQTSWFFVKE